MKIESYISQLLYRHQLVTVPGFGAFLTELQSSQWNENNNTFSPPKKLISFNSYLQHNDGLLANHISVKEKITYELAVNSIQSQVASWKNQLLEHKSLVLPNIGVVSVNSEGNLNFEPQSQINYNKASFGLSSLIAPPVKRIIQIPVEESEEEIISLIPETTRTRSYGFFKYAAVFILALSAAGSMGYKMFIDRIDQETMLVQKEVQEEVQNKIQEATFFIQNPLPNVTLTVKEQKLSYHIVAGAFRDEQNAQKIYERLSQEGFKSRRLEKNKYGLYPVLYGSYTTYEESRSVLKDIKKTQNPEAWILIQDL